MGINPYYIPAKQPLKQWQVDQYAPLPIKEISDFGDFAREQEQPITDLQGIAAELNPWYSDIDEANAIENEYNAKAAELASSPDMYKNPRRYKQAVSALTREYAPMFKDIKLREQASAAAQKQRDTLLKAGKDVFYDQEAEDLDKKGLYTIDPVTGKRVKSQLNYTPNITELQDANKYAETLVNDVKLDDSLIGLQDADVYGYLESGVISENMTKLDEMRDGVIKSLTDSQAGRQILDRAARAYNVDGFNQLTPDEANTLIEETADRAIKERMQEKINKQYRVNQPLMEQQQRSWQEEDDEIVMIDQFTDEFLTPKGGQANVGAEDLANTFQLEKNENKDTKGTYRAVGKNIAFNYGNTSPIVPVSKDGGEDSVGKYFEDYIFTDNYKSDGVQGNALFANSTVNKINTQGGRKAFTNKADLARYNKEAKDDASVLQRTGLANWTLDKKITSLKMLGWDGAGFDFVDDSGNYVGKFDENNKSYKSAIKKFNEYNDKWSSKTPDEKKEYKETQNVAAELTRLISGKIKEGSNVYLPSVNLDIKTGSVDDPNYKTKYDYNPDTKEWKTYGDTEVTVYISDKEAGKGDWYESDSDTANFLDDAEERGLVKRNAADDGWIVDSRMSLDMGDEELQSQATKYNKIQNPAASQKPEHQNFWTGNREGTQDIIAAGNRFASVHAKNFLYKDKTTFSNKFGVPVKDYTHNERLEIINKARTAYVNSLLEQLKGQ
jgi:hypothetical protein